MREIVLDTETTGLDPADGHRIVEIGCIELANHFPSGRTFHHYLNPQRAVPSDAAKIHGLEDAFLADKPKFSKIAAELIDFIGNAKIVAHNAAFDLSFLNAELKRAALPVLAAERMIDTLEIARIKLPGAKHTLDALVSRYKIKAGKRSVHGALLDAGLLAEVYLELIGGRQTSLISLMAGPIVDAADRVIVAARQRPEPRLFTITDAELAAHRAAVEAIGAGSIWRKWTKELTTRAPSSV